MKNKGLSVLTKCLAGAALILVLSLGTGEECKAGSVYDVHVQKGYLALRTAKAYDSANEIGELYNGDYVWVENKTDETYWYVYAPSLDLYGYVNSDYLLERDAGDTWTVSVEKGYLALRTAKAYDSANEIGELYSGDTVRVENKNDSTYWYVYSPKYDTYGYVNKDYLIAQNAFDSYYVSVEKGYLALRTAKAYDSANEKGELYNGDMVEVVSRGDDTYWYVYSPKYDSYGYVNKDYLVPRNDYDTCTVSVSKGYLALRTAKAYDSSNEIGELYSGDTVEVINTSDSQYWYVYAPGLGKYGYVNKDYLLYEESRISWRTWRVSVKTGYLALRSEQYYSEANELGELYNGDSVEVITASDSQYWYVYAPSLGMYGYVNSDYLVP